jgi:hypothetical protein
MEDLKTIWERIEASQKATRLVIQLSYLLIALLIATIILYPFFSY